MFKAFSDLVVTISNSEMELDCPFFKEKYKQTTTLFQELTFNLINAILNLAR